MKPATLHDQQVAEKRLEYQRALRSASKLNTEMDLHREQGTNPPLQLRAHYGIAVWTVGHILRELHRMTEV